MSTKRALLGMWGFGWYSGLFVQAFTREWWMWIACPTLAIIGVVASRMLSEMLDARDARSVPPQAKTETENNQ